MPSYSVPGANALLTADGGVGIFFVATPFEFSVSAKIRLTSDTQEPLDLIVLGVHYETGSVTCLSARGGFKPDLTAYTVADGARVVQDAQLVSDDVMPVSVVRQSGELYADVCPPLPDPEVYLPVRLTNGASFYNATGGGSGGGTVDQGMAGTDPWPVTGPLTNAQLRASAVPVDASGSTVSVLNFPVTQGISGTVNQGTAAALASAWPAKVTDGSNTLVVNADGSINTVQPATSIAYDEVTGVAAGVETTVLSVTAPADLRLKKVTASGDNVSIFRVKVDGSTVATKRSGWLTPNVDFDFEGLVLTTGQVLVITALHDRPDTGTYEASATTT